MRRFLTPILLCLSLTGACADRGKESGQPPFQVDGGGSSTQGDSTVIRPSRRITAAKLGQIGAPYPGLAPAKAPDASVDSRIRVSGHRRPTDAAKPAEPAQLRVTALHAGEAVVADLYVNDKKVDKTPALLNLPHGNYRLSVRRIGFTSKTWTVQLEPGQKKRELVELER